MPRGGGKKTAREGTSSKRSDTRRKQSKKSEEYQRVPAQVEVEVKPKKPSSRREVDVEVWIEKNIDEVVARSGLDYLGISREVWIEVLRDLLVDLYGSTSSYKSAEDVAKRLVRNAERVMPIVAARLAHALDNPSPDQVEFIVINITDSILELAPKLHSWVAKLGKTDLLSILKAKWSAAWSRSKTPLLPVACPRCGFNSLMPDLTCLVCGASVTEGELKNYLDFSHRILDISSSTSCEELREFLRYDYVLVNDLELKPPSASRLPIDIEVYLGRADKEILKKSFESRCLSEIAK